MTVNVNAKRKPPEERHQQRILEDEKKFEQWCEDDLFNNFEELKNRMKIIDVKDFLIQEHSDFVLLYKVNVIDIPLIISSIKIFSNFEIEVCLNGCKVPSTKYSWIFGSSLRCLRASMLESLLSHLNGFCINFKPEVVDRVNNVCASLSECITDLENSSENALPLLQKLKFLKEQLELSVSLKPKYSPDVLLWASSVFFPFPGGYTMIRSTNILTIPHPSYLRKFSASMKSEDSLKKNQIHYLSEKCKLLQEHEKVVNVLLDEIHVLQKITYRGGHLEGVTQNNEVVNKIQAFMLASVFSSNEDIVALYPVRKTSAQDLKELTLDVLKVLCEAGYVVVSLISDNNRINRNMFAFLCGGTIQPCISNPYRNEQKLFILFDTVHLFKSIRNNWLNQRNEAQSFIFPSLDDPNCVLHANVKDLKVLHASEEHNVVKLAPSLSKKVLNPSNFERQNVALAVRLFDEKNIAALETCFKEKDCGGTAVFLKTILSWWKIVNVRSPKTGYHLRDPLRFPIRSADDANVLYLSKFSSFLYSWQNLQLSCTGHSGKLTSDTYSSLHLTTTTLCLLIKYMFETYANCKYLLLGKFQTDPLESRFGRYRQMCGSCYHVSVSQVFDAEKKLKIISLLKLKSATFGEFSLKDFTCVNTPVEEVEGEFDEYLNAVIFESRDLDINENEEAVLLFIAGYVSHSLLKYFNDCKNCKEIFLSDKDLTVEFVNKNASSYLLNLCRGGLKKPSHFIYKITREGYKLFQVLISSEFEIMFVRCTNQRGVFKHALMCNLEMLFDCNNQCSCGTSIFSLMSRVSHVLANIFLNNYSKIANDKILRQNDQRKVLTFSK